MTTTYRDQANAVIREILASLKCAIIREPDPSFCSGFLAALPCGGRFYIKADSVRYAGPCRIELSANWGECATVRGSGRPERGTASIVLRNFLPTGEGPGNPSVDPSRPLPALLKDLDRRFFSRLKELWPLAEAYRAQQEADVEAYLATAALCQKLKLQTAGGHSLTPDYIGHAGEYARFQLAIPADKLASFYAWCWNAGVGR